MQRGAIGWDLASGLLWRSAAALHQLTAPAGPEEPHSQVLLSPAQPSEPFAVRGPLVSPAEVHAG